MSYGAGQRIERGPEESTQRKRFQTESAPGRKRGRRTRTTGNGAQKSGSRTLIQKPYALSKNATRLCAYCWSGELCSRPHCKFAHAYPTPHGPAAPRATLAPPARPTPPQMQAQTPTGGAGAPAGDGSSAVGGEGPRLQVIVRYSRNYAGGGGVRGPRGHPPWQGSRRQHMTGRALPARRAGFRGGGLHGLRGPHTKLDFAGPI